VQTQPALAAEFRQPRDALNPSAFAIEAAEGWALDRAAKLPADLFRLTSFWFAEFVRQAVPGERKTHYTMRLAQSEDYGIAFGPVAPLSACDRDLLGEDSREVLRHRRYRDDIDRVALIDLVMAHVVTAPDQVLTAEASVRDKQALRSRLFADEAWRVIARRGNGLVKGARPLVLVVGATVGIISALASRGFDVAATDMGADAIGQTFGGVTVRDAGANAGLAAEADLAIITGMTFPNRTLPALMAAAKAHNTSTLIWAITGRNFGHYYIENGADCVISDPSPFFLLPGPAKIAIWRRDR
jgi:hypothetical protein